MIWEYLLPNFNLDALVGIPFIILGILLLVYRVSPVKKLMTQAGWILILGGTIYWFVVSFMQDILANTKLTAVIIVVILLMVSSVVIYLPRKKR